MESGRITTGRALRSSGLQTADQLELLRVRSAAGATRRRLDRTTRARGLAGVARARQALAQSHPLDGRWKQAS